MSGGKSVGTYAREYLEATRESLAGDYIERGLEAIVPVFQRARKEGKSIFFFGNGGSAATSSHMSQDIGKLTIAPGRPRFRCQSLADPISLILAWANDSSYSEIFAEQVKSLGREGDVALGISGSGNSPNVLRALEEARKAKMTTVGLIGTGGGKMKALCDIALIVPSSNMQHIEDVHHIVLHLLAAYLRDSPE